MHKFGQETAILVVDDNWLGQTHGNAQGNAELSRGEIGITGDDGSSTEIDAFSHQIAADASVLGIQATSNALEGAPSALRHWYRALDFVVDNHCDKVLQNHGQVLDDMRRCIGGDSILQILVGFDDVAVDVCQVILASLVGVHFHGGAHGRGCDRQHLANHPVGSRPSCAKAHEFDIFIGNALKYFQHDFGGDFHGIVAFGGTIGGGFFVDEIFPNGVNGGHAFEFDLVGLFASTTTFSQFATAFHFLAQGVHIIPSIIRVHLKHLSVLFFANEKFAAHDFFHVLYEEHGPRHFDATKVSGGLDVSLAVGRADSSGPENTHPGVEKAARCFLVVYVCVFGNHFDNRRSSDFLRRRHGKLNANDARRILIRIVSLMIMIPLHYISVYI